MKRVLSLGAGVQSTTVALMIKHGEIEMVDAAIFADTQAEPAEVYTHLTWLQQQDLGFPIIVATHGDLDADTRQVRDSARTPGNRYMRNLITLFLTDNTTGKKGMLTRKCTVEYKIRVIERETKKLCGFYGKRAPTAPVVTTLVGISQDEAGRARASARGAP